MSWSLVLVVPQLRMKVFWCYWLSLGYYLPKLLLGSFFFRNFCVVQNKTNLILFLPFPLFPQWAQLLNLYTRLPLSQAQDNTVQKYSCFSGSQSSQGQHLASTFRSCLLLLPPEICHVWTYHYSLLFLILVYPSSPVISACFLFLITWVLLSVVDSPGEMLSFWKGVFAELFGAPSTPTPPRHCLFS